MFTDHLNKEELKLDRESKVPYYHQIYIKLKEIILNNEVQKNKLIPDEKTLSEIFNVSRGTVRLALKELEYKDYISRERGRGTFVKDKIFETHSLQQVSSILEELKKEKVVTKISILDNRVIKSTKELRYKLLIDDNNKNGGIHLTSVHTIYRLKCRVYKILQTLHIVVTPVK